MDRCDPSGKTQNCLLNERTVTRRYELLLKVYYLKAVQILEIAGYISNIIITGTTLMDVIIEAS